MANRTQQRSGHKTNIILHSTIIELNLFE